MDGTTYYAIVLKPGYIELAKTASDATSNTPIQLDPSRASGTEHSLEADSSDAKVGIGASVAVNLVNDTTTAGTQAPVSGEPFAAKCGGVRATAHRSTSAVRATSRSRRLTPTR